MAKFQDLVDQGTRATQPSAGVEGRLYFVTDEDVLEYDNGSSWDSWASSSGGITWAGSTTTDGTTYDRSTSSSFLRQTGRLWLFQPLKITKFTIDVRNASTYKLYIAQGPGSADSVKVITAAKVVSSGGAIDFVPDDGDFVLLPAIYYITLEAASSVTWWDSNLNDDPTELFWNNVIYYNTASYSTYTAPFRITAYKGVPDF